MVWESLRYAPEDFWGEVELCLVVAEGVEARWDVGEVVEALAIVAAAAAVGGVADSAEKKKIRCLVFVCVCVRERERGQGSLLVPSRP